VGLVVALLGAAALVFGSLPGAAQPQPSWAPVSPGVHLVQPAFWASFADAQAVDGTVVLTGHTDAVGEPELLAAPDGARVAVAHDFRLVTTLRATGDGRAVLALIDVPAGEEPPGAGRIEVGFEAGQVVLAAFGHDPAAPLDSQRISAPVTPTRPTPLVVSRIGPDVHLELGGEQVASVAAPDLFAGGQVWLGARVASDTTLTVQSLDVLAPATEAGEAHVLRCTPARLLIASSEMATNSSQIAWVSLADGTVSPVEIIPNQLQRTYLVATSPDGRWATYYQRSATAPSDRFVVDTWVMDLVSDTRYRLVEGNAPIAWSGDSHAVVLGERPFLMATVPTGDLVATEGQLVAATAMRSTVSPDGAYRATVASMPNGAAGVTITDVSAGELRLRVATGRGAVQLAWSPDSTKLAYTSGVDTASGLDWRLRMVDLNDDQVTLVDSTRQLEVHSVLWVPALPGCP
jgi:hypothetical protein